MRFVVRRVGRVAAIIDTLRPDRIKEKRAVRVQMVPQRFAVHWIAGDGRNDFGAERRKVRRKLAVTQAITLQRDCRDRQVARDFSGFDAIDAVAQAQDRFREKSSNVNSILHRVRDRVPPQLKQLPDLAGEFSGGGFDRKLVAANDPDANRRHSQQFGPLDGFDRIQW